MAKFLNVTLILFLPIYCIMYHFVIISHFGAFCHKLGALDVTLAVEDF